MEWTSYHRLEDIHGYLDYLAETFPDVCSVVSIGNSVEGRPLKVTDYVEIPRVEREITRKITRDAGDTN